MKPLAIEIRHFRYFIAVVEQGGVRAAAQYLHVSQPPLTRQIHQLEEIVGTPLISRGPHGAVATEAGRELYVEARNILAVTLRALRRAKLIGHGMAGRIDIGVFGSPIFDMIPRVVGAFSRRNAGVEVALHTMNRSQQIKALRERRIDVGFNRFMGSEPGLRWETIEKQPLKVAVYEGHTLARKARLRLADLVSEHLIFYPRAPRPGFMDYVLGLFAKRNLTPRNVTNVDDVPTAIAMVSSGLGMTIVPSSASNVRLASVKYLPLAKADGGIVDSCLIYRDEDPSALLQKFLLAARADYKSSTKST